MQQGFFLVMVVPPGLLLSKERTSLADSSNAWAFVDGIVAELDKEAKRTKQIDTKKARDDFILLKMFTMKIETMS